MLKAYDAVVITKIRFAKLPWQLQTILFFIPTWWQDLAQSSRQKPDNMCPSVARIIISHTAWFQLLCEGILRATGRQYIGAVTVAVCQILALATGLPGMLLSGRIIGGLYSNTFYGRWSVAEPGHDKASAGVWWNTTWPKVGDFLSQLAGIELHACRDVLTSKYV